MVELSGISRDHWLAAVKDGLGLEEPEIGVMDPEGGQLNSYRAPSSGTGRTGAARA